LSTILAEADRLMLIIQQVLDASKLEAKKVKFDFHEVDLRSIKENSSIKGLEEQAKSKGLYFKWEIDSNLPDISCDLNKLVQVFVNLIGNAVKFTEEGGITVSMFAKTKRTIECDIIDTGIGISEDDRKKLFRQFYQAQKKTLARQDGAGTGLGLSITKNIINLHGGKINVESKIGSGSKFWFTLPTGRRKRKEKEE
jgi:signal transduction histidine kinase